MWFALVHKSTECGTYYYYLHFTFEYTETEIKQHPQSPPVAFWCSRCRHTMIVGVSIYLEIDTALCGVIVF